MTRHAAVVCLVVALIGSPLGSLASAQGAFPTKPVKFVIPYPGGGSNDVLARIVGEKLHAKWGQPIVVENRTGAGGNIGGAAVWNADPDGYTLLVSASPPIAINQSLYKGLSYKADELVPISIWGSVPNLVIVRKDLPVNSVKELIEHAKANPGKLVYGSQGVGNTPHLTANMFMGMTGTSMVHVPYRGETLVLNDMLGGRVDVFFGNISGSLALIRDGKVRALAVLDKRRANELPDVPTIAEQGLPELLSGAWYGMVAPPKLKPELQAQLGRDTVEALKMADVQQKFRNINVEPMALGPQVGGVHQRRSAALG